MSSPTSRIQRTRKMDSDLLKRATIVIAFGLAAAACICVSASEYLAPSSGSGLVLSLALTAGTLFGLAMAILALHRCYAMRGRTRVSVITVRGGEFRKRPPVRGKGPSQ